MGTESERTIIAAAKMSTLNLFCIFLAILPFLCYGFPQSNSGSSGSGPAFKCKVEEKKSKSLQDCAFPFKLNDKPFTNCTDFQDPDGRLWCSTKVSRSNRQHVGGGGYWGYCNIVSGKCPQDDNEEILLRIIDTVQEQQTIF